MIEAATALTLQPLRLQDMEPVVQLHQEALGYSFNSQLGGRHLAHIYQVMRCDENSLVVTAHRGGLLVGVVSATRDPEALKTRLISSLTPRQWFGLIGRLALRPQLLFTWLADQRVNSRPVTFRGVTVRPYLAAIAVAERARQAGVGRALVGAVDDFFRARRCPAYHLDTLADNAASRVFYRRLGFVELEQRGPAVILVKTLLYEASN